MLVFSLVVLILGINCVNSQTTGIPATTGILQTSGSTTFTTTQDISTSGITTRGLTSGLLQTSGYTPPTTNFNWYANQSNSTTGKIGNYSTTGSNNTVPNNSVPETMAYKVGHIKFLDSITFNTEPYYTYFEKFCCNFYGLCFYGALLYVPFWLFSWYMWYATGDHYYIEDLAQFITERIFFNLFSKCNLRRWNSVEEFEMTVSHGKFDRKRHKKSLL